MTLKTISTVFFNKNTTNSHKYKNRVMILNPYPEIKYLKNSFLNLKNSNFIIEFGFMIFTMSVIC